MLILVLIASFIDCALHWGVSLAAAVPRNDSDPFYEQWLKQPPPSTTTTQATPLATTRATTAADNPIAQGVEGAKDPSSAWQTKDGESRFTADHYQY